MSLNDRLFSCTRCGACCQGFGGTYLKREEIRAIAEYIGESEKDFTERYCVPSGRRLVLSQSSDGYCVFYNRARNCAIHPVKPRMCRQWPFIDNLRIDMTNWYIMADSCPGMKRDLDEKQLFECLRGVLGDET